MILVLGSGRSGTTLLAKLLDSHPNVLYRHEPDSIYPNPDIPFRPKSKDVSVYIDKTKLYLNELMNARYIKSSTHSPVFDKIYRSKSQKLSFLLLHHIMKALGAGLKLKFVQQKIMVPDLINQNYKSDIVYVVKSVNALNRAYLFSCSDPTMKIIHIVRHPCGVVASLLRGMRTGRMKKNIFLNAIEDMDESKKFPIPVKDIRGRTIEEQLAYQWSIFNDSVFRQLNGSDRYKLVKYEDLCVSLSDILGCLFDFCGLDFSDQSHSFIELLENQEEGDRRYFSIIRDPRQSATKWRSELSPEQVMRIESVVCHSELGSSYLGHEHSAP